MTIKEYTVDDSGNFKCVECGTDEDIVFEEDGNPICTDCLFEKQCDEMGYGPNSYGPK